jgi:hypothetical protein
MLMSPSARKFALTAHVVSSLGWVGALTVFLAHSIVSVVSHDVQLVRAACLAMGLTAWFVILPFSLASLATGLLQALGTAWGLLRHYWVLVKLLLTLVATAVLLSKLAPISGLAAAAQALNFTFADSPDLKVSLLAHATGGLVVLLVATVLAIYKPTGITPRGARLLHRERSGTDGAAIPQAGTPRWVRSCAIVGVLLVLLAAALTHFHGALGSLDHTHASQSQ